MDQSKQLEAIMKMQLKSLPTKLAAIALVFAVGLIGRPATAHLPANGRDKSSGTRLAQAMIELEVLKGRWVRPDGGYAITIKSVDPSGKMDATYANPNPIDVAKALVSREGGVLRVFLELRGARYDGSTYTLTYDPTGDRLSGVYFQAVLNQKFEVIFQRAK